MEHQPLDRKRYNTDESHSDVWEHIISFRHLGVDKRLTDDVWSFFSILISTVAQSF